MSIVRELPSSVLDTAPMVRRRGVRRIPGTFTIAVAATMIGLLAGVVSMRSGLAVAYADAESHMSIARRLWDGVAPGFGQLGTVWLPIPHLLLAPFTLIALVDEDGWRAGLAAVMLSSLCLGVTAAAMYRVLVRIGVTSLAAGLTGLAVLIFNPTILYLHTTAMTEPVLIAAMAMATAGLSGFIASVRPLSGGEMMVYVGLPAAVGVGSRYDGWAFAALLVGTIVVIAQTRWGSWGYSLRVAVSTAFPSAVIGLWWIVLNWAQYGDILAFQRGPYSAQNLQKQFERLGVLPTKGSLWVSLDTYSWTVLFVLGTVVLALTLVGLVVSLTREGFSARLAPMWLLTFTYPYYVVTLAGGQSVIWHAMTSPPGLFNIRYAAPLLLVSAIAIAYLLQSAHEVARARLPLDASGIARLGPRTVSVVASVSVAGIVLSGYAAQLSDPVANVPAIEEADRMRVGGADVSAAVEFLRAQREPGQTVLLDETVNAVLVRLGIGFNDVSARFTPGFAAQLDDPTADWILCQSGQNPDEVCATATTEPVFAQRYVVAFTAGDSVVLQHVNPS